MKVLAEAKTTKETFAKGHVDLPDTVTTSGRKAFESCYLMYMMIPMH